MLPMSKAKGLSYPIIENWSFQFVRYYAYAEKALPIQYIAKLEWTKQNTPQEEFKYVLSCLGVDVSRLSNL